jgi:hypothetical protein
MRELACDVLFEVDEAWLDHGEKLQRAENFQDDYAEYENFLFELEQFALRLEKHFSVKFDEIGKSTASKLNSLMFHPFADPSMVERKVRFGIRQELKINDHQSIMLRSTQAIAKSIEILRKLPEPVRYIKPI